MAHHTSALGIAIELAVIALVAALLCLVWWRGRRRRTDGRAVADMRDHDR